MLGRLARFSSHGPSVVGAPFGRRRPIDAAAAATVSLLAVEARLVAEARLRATTECVDEDAAELLAEDAVEDKVDGAVGDHHQAADARQLDERGRVEHLGRESRHEDVVDDGRHLTDEEDGDDRDDHHREVVLPPLAVGHLADDALRALDRATQL